LGTAALSAIGLGAGAAGTGCNISCEGGSWQDQPYVMCAAQGTATISAPASLGLPASASLVRGTTCLDTARTCTEQPTLFFEAVASSGRTIASVEIHVPAATGPASYTLPLVRPASGPAPDVSATVYYFPEGGGAEAFTVVSGTIDVPVSTPDELRASFSFMLRLPSTGDLVTVDGADDDVAPCHVVTRSVCVGGD